MNFCEKKVAKYLHTPVCSTFTPSFIKIRIFWLGTFPCKWEYRLGSYIDYLFSDEKDEFSNKIGIAPKPLLDRYLMTDGILAERRSSNVNIRQQLTDPRQTQLSNKLFNSINN